MRKKDLLFFTALAAALCALLGPALLSPGAALANFGDLYAYHWPLRQLVAARLQEGGLPAWNPYIFSGLPLLADPQTALFYPLSALFHVFPVGWAFTLSAALHLALAALGMQLLMRRAGLDAAGSAVLAAAFAFSPMLVYRIPQGIPTQLAVLAWTPWTWLALLAGRAGLLGGVWALQFLAGHPQYAFINALGLGLFALSSPRTRLKTLFLAAALAAPSALLQLAPTLEFLSASNRVGWSQSAAYSLPPAALLTLGLPAPAGSPLEGTFAGWTSEFFEYHSFFVGLGILLLALMGLRTRRGLFGTSPWALLSVGVFLALGGNNPLLPLERLPLVGLLRVPARFALLVFWGTLLAAAAGWALLRARGWLSRPARAALLLLVLVQLGALSACWVRAEDPAGWMEPRPEFAELLGGRRVRFASGPEVANPNKAMLYRAMNVSGYEAFYLRRYQDALMRAGETGLDASRVLPERLGQGIYRRLGTAWQLGGEGLKPLPDALLPIARAEGIRTRVGGRSPERWRVFGDRGAPARLVFAMPAYPGWRAFLSTGEELSVSFEEGLFQAVDVPAGGWEVDFIFRPTLWTLWALTSAAAAALWLALAFRGLSA